jgi:hypothetical protein
MAPPSDCASGGGSSRRPPCVSPQRLEIEVVALDLDERKHWSDRPAVSDDGLTSPFRSSPLEPLTKYVILFAA